MNTHLQNQITLSTAHKHNQETEIWLFPLQERSGDIKEHILIEKKPKSIRVIKEQQDLKEYYKVDNIQNAEAFVNDIIQKSEKMVVVTPEQFLLTYGIEMKSVARQNVTIFNSFQHKIDPENGSDEESLFELDYDAVEEIEETLQVTVFEKQTGMSVLELEGNHCEEEIVDIITQNFPLITKEDLDIMIEKVLL